VTQGNEVYGIPHWVCGNFLFSRKDEPRLANVDSISALGAVVSKGGLLIDMRGSSTLGELYLSAGAGTYGSFAAAQGHLEASKLEDKVLDPLKRLLSWCPGGYCRVADYHDRLGFYARQFSRRRAIAYVGYSESLYYLGLEARQSCPIEEKCLSESDKDVQVSAMPFSERVHSIGWTDVLALDTSCTEQCEADARTFITFYTSDQTTKALLVPPWGQAPRYLLPARTRLYTDQELTQAAPLYPRLLELISKAEIVTARSLNSTLRAIGEQLDDPGKGPLPDNPPRTAGRRQ
jgi:thiamine pyridinylase